MDNPNWTIEKWRKAHRMMHRLPWQSKLLGEWENKAVYSREEVERMLRRGEISEQRADEMLHMIYKCKGEKNVEVPEESIL